MPEIFLKVIDSDGNAIEHGPLKPPIVLGRGRTATVRFDIDGDVISRQHAELRFKDSKLIVVNLSKNLPTRAGSKLLSTLGAEASIADDETLGIGEYTIKISKLQLFMQALVSYDSTSLRQVFAIDRDGISVVSNAKKSPSTWVINGGSENQGAEIIANIQFGDTKGLIHFVSPPRGKCMLNGAKLEDGPVELSEFDVIVIDDMRIEIVHPRTHALRCINPSCARLSGYRPNENCPWCGYKLTEANSVLQA